MDNPKLHNLFCGMLYETHVTDSQEDCVVHYRKINFMILAYYIVIAFHKSLPKKEFSWNL